MQPQESAVQARQVILYAAGGHSKSVISTLVETPSWDIAGLINVHPVERPEAVLGFPVLGDDTVLPDLLARGLRHIHLCMGDNQERAEAGQRLKAMGFELATIQHPSAKMCPFSEVGAGTFMHMYSLMGAECVAGEGCIIQPFVNTGHGTRLGNYVQLAPGVNTGGDCVIEDQVFIGLGAAVMPGLRIGRNAIIGANAVVREDVPDNAVVVGNPGRVIKIKSV